MPRVLTFVVSWVTGKIFQVDGGTEAPAISVPVPELWPRREDARGFVSRPLPPAARYARGAMLKLRWLYIALCLPSLACVAPVIDRTWVEVRTPNFVIWSAVDTAQTEELARELEEFIQIVGMFTTIGRFEPRVLTRIFLVPGLVPEVGLTSKRLGFFLEGLRENRAIVRTSGSGGRAGQVLYHEYTHFLVHNRDATQYPAWFDEGFADLLATVEVDGKQVDVGKPDLDRIQSLVHLQWLPYGKIIEGEDHSSWSGERNALFYAQSWALVHYLHWGREDRSFPEDNTRYLRQVEEGRPAREAFEEAFDESLDRLDERIERYLRREMAYKRLTLKQPLPAAELTSRPLSREEVAVQLGAFALNTGSPSARAYFQEALTLNPDNPRALAGLGDTYKFAGEMDTARPLFERSVALDPGDPLNHLDYGEFLFDLAREASDPDDRSQLLEDARYHYLQAEALRPRMPETLAVRGATFLLDGQDATRGIEPLEAAHALLPGSSYVKLPLAQAYAAVGRPREAIVLLRKLLAWSHGDNQAIFELLASLEAELLTAEPDDSGTD